MKVATRKSRTKLKVSKEEIAVAAPSGYHWMEESGRYYLMEGKLTQPHPGSMEEAKFKVASHG
tara:strand:+ start:107 stop:295 length:189 start_codon:yes stop_codon:yes gene_type:complete